MAKRSSILKIVVLCGALLLIVGIAYHWNNKPCAAVSAQQGGLSINLYNEQRDRDDILQLFKDDWNWLSTRDYSYDRLVWQLNSGSPNEYEPRYFGKMRIAVLRDNGAFAGFITYYMKNFHEGIVLFLAIHKNFRGKRYGQKLLDFASQELKKMGANAVSLVTRVTNQSGINLYKRAGFTQTLDVDPNFYQFKKAV